MESLTRYRKNPLIRRHFTKDPSITSNSITFNSHLHIPLSLLLKGVYWLVVAHRLVPGWAITMYQKYVVDRGREGRCWLMGLPYGSGHTGSVMVNRQNFTLSESGSLWLNRLMIFTFQISRAAAVECYQFSWFSVAKDISTFILSPTKANLQCQNIDYWLGYGENVKSESGSQNNYFFLFVWKASTP